MLPARHRQEPTLPQASTSGQRRHHELAQRAEAAPHQCPGQQLLRVTDSGIHLYTVFSHLGVIFISATQLETTHALLRRTRAHQGLVRPAQEL